MKVIMAMVVLAGLVSQGAAGKEKSMPRVTGIGGVFFKAKGDPKALSTWYQEHLGVKLEVWGGTAFRWNEDPRAANGATAWMIADKNSPMFKVPDANFIINYRVDDLDGMIANLKKAGIKVEGPTPSDLGKFASLQDPEGNQIELWEPAGS